MSCQQKPLSLNEDWFTPALPLGSGTALLAQEDFLKPGLSFIRRPLLEATNSNLSVTCYSVCTCVPPARVRGTNIWHLISCVFNNTLYGVISCVEDSVVSFFFPVFILDLVDLLSAQQMPEPLLHYNSTSLSSLPWTRHYARSLCSVRARNGERNERGESPHILRELTGSGRVY